MLLVGFFINEEEDKSEYVKKLLDEKKEEYYLVSKEKIEDLIRNKVFSKKKYFIYSL